MRLWTGIGLFVQELSASLHIGLAAFGHAVTNRLLELPILRHLVPFPAATPSIAGLVRNRQIVPRTMALALVAPGGLGPRRLGDTLGNQRKSTIAPDQDRIETGLSATPGDANFGRLKSGPDRAGCPGGVGAQRWEPAPLLLVTATRRLGLDLIGPLCHNQRRGGC